MCWILILWNIHNIWYLTCTVQDNYFKVNPTCLAAKKSL